MARQIRAKSESGIYHVMLRGINKQQVFFDNDDYYMFLNILSKFKTISGFKLYAYCLMRNHVHILLQEGDEPLSKALKRIGDSFIYWYNTKYDRIGGIFQGRFTSVPVDTDEYFISAIRYIHQNPVKAGLVNKCSDYEFSSYNKYYQGNSFVDTGFALEMIGINEFTRIHKQECKETHLEINDAPVIKISDIEAKRIIEIRTNCKSPEEFLSLPRDTQKEYVKYLRKEGLSIRQLTLLTGVSQRTAQCR